MTQLHFNCPIAPSLLISFLLRYSTVFSPFFAVFASLRDQIKRVRLIRRADGYYVQFCVKVDVGIETEPTNNTIGLDLGLNYFIPDGNGEVWESPKFYRKAEHQLNRANRKKSKKYRRGVKLQSSNYHKARNRYARKHLRVSRQRKEYCSAICVLRNPS